MRFKTEKFPAPKRALNDSKERMGGKTPECGGLYDGEAPPLWNHSHQDSRRQRRKHTWKMDGRRLRVSGRRERCSAGEVFKNITPKKFPAQKKVLNDPKEC